MVLQTQDAGVFRAPCTTIRRNPRGPRGFGRSAPVLGRSKLHGPGRAGLLADLPASARGCSRGRLLSDLVAASPRCVLSWRETSVSIRVHPWLRKKNAGRFHQDEAVGSNVADSQSRQQGHGTGAGGIAAPQSHHRMEEASESASDKWRETCRNGNDTSPRPSPRTRRRGSRAHTRLVTCHPSLTVRPDIVFRKLRTVVFVDGCFWHGCPKHCNPMKWLKKSSMPAGNPPSPKGRLRRTGRAFWRRKLHANKRRDQLVNRTLRKTGWRVVRIWECVLARRPGTCVRRIQRALV